VVRLGDEHIDIEVTLSLIGLLRQYVSRMRMATLDLARGSQAHSLRSTLMGFQFRHSLVSFTSLFPIANCQLPIADLVFQLAIGNRQ